MFYMHLIHLVLIKVTRRALLLSPHCADETIEAQKGEVNGLGSTVCGRAETSPQSLIPNSCCDTSAGAADSGRFVEAVFRALMSDSQL